MTDIFGINLGRPSPCNGPTMADDDDDDDELTIYSNITVSLFETFMTISTKNAKSGTNGILPHRIKCSITLDWQVQNVSIK